MVSGIPSTRLRAPGTAPAEADRFSNWQTRRGGRLARGVQLHRRSRGHAGSRATSDQASSSDHVAVRAAFPLVAAPLRSLRLSAASAVHPMSLSHVVAVHDVHGNFTDDETNQAGSRGAYSGLSLILISLTARALVPSFTIVAYTALAAFLGKHGAIGHVDTAHGTVQVVIARLAHPGEVAPVVHALHPHVRRDVDVRNPHVGGSGGGWSLLRVHGDASADKVAQSSCGHVGILIGFRSPLSTPSPTAFLTDPSMIPSATSIESSENSTVVHSNCQDAEGAIQRGEMGAATDTVIVGMGNRGG